MTRQYKEAPKRPQVTDMDKKIHTLFNSELGKEVLKIFEQLFYNNSTFVQGDGNTNFIMYKIGQQDVVGFIKESMYLVETTPSIVVPGDSR